MKTINSVALVIGMVTVTLITAACQHRIVHSQGDASPDGIVYQRFVHPRGDYTLEYPSSWEHSPGMQTLNVYPADKSARVSIGLYPLDRADSITLQDFIAEELRRAEVLHKHLDSRDTINVSGRTAERLILTETMELKGDDGKKLPGPLTEVIVVVSYGTGYYVLRLSAISDELRQARPEFDHIVASFKFGSAP